MAAQAAPAAHGGVRARGEHPVHHAGAPRGGRQDVRGVDELLDRVLEPARAVLERRDALPEVWVLELSSFQLDGATGFEPTAATVLNV
ncbi:hypothetical protein, partial [Dermacoccus nishinomiyaensis]|uniref:hypothetical protein n=1 Tax=Dermacoccus nishinomiyaensis TaxID=1274 RepID=UPI00248DE7EF